MLLPADLANRLTPEYVSSLPSEMQEELIRLLEERETVENETKLSRLYPDTGPLRRELYPKHIEFFAAGAQHQERCVMAANRVGKTWGIGGYETTLHLTGDYPEWWVGCRFDSPIDAWVAGDTTETTRDIVQVALLGTPGELGTGLIPAAAIIGEPSKKGGGVVGAVDTVKVKWKDSDQNSTLGFKAYDQGRKKFQGTAKKLIWLDEEPPEDVYDECMMRLMTTDGLMLCTFTPLLGMSQIAKRFVEALPK
jgi:phage terminase large subunit-like protein